MDEQGAWLDHMLVWNPVHGDVDRAFRNGLRHTHPFFAVVASQLLSSFRTTMSKTNPIFLILIFLIILILIRNEKSLIQWRGRGRVKSGESLRVRRRSR